MSSLDLANPTSKTENPVYFPSMENKVNWGEKIDLPPASLWTSYKARQVAGKALITLAAALGCATAAAALQFTATPVVVIGVVISLAVATLAALVTGVVYLTLKPSLADPEVLLKARIDAGQDLDHNVYTYNQIREKYQVDIVPAKHINDLIRSEIQDLAYPEFAKRRGEDILDILDQKNREALKASLLKYVTAAENNFESAAIARMPSFIKLNIPPSEYALTIAQNQANKPYAEFRAKNGAAILQELIAKNPETRANFQQKYLQLPYPQLTKFKADRQFLQISPEMIAATLKQRWESPSILALVADDDFIASLAVEFKPEEWRAKAEVDTAHLSVIEIVKDYPQLVDHGILQHDALQVRLANEILSFPTLPELVETLGAAFLEKGLLTNQMEHLVGLAENYVKARDSFFIQGDLNALDKWVVQQRLIPPNLAAQLNQAHAEFKQYSDTFSIAKENILADKVSKIQQLIQDRDLFISPAHAAVEENTLRYQQAENGKNTAEKRLEADKAKIAALSKQLDALYKEESDLRQEVNSIPGAKECALQESQQTRVKIKRLSSKIERLEAAKHTSELAIIELRRQIDCTPRVQTIRQSIIHQKQRLNQLTAQEQRFQAEQQRQREHESLAASIHSTRQRERLAPALNQNVTGLRDAMRAVVGSRTNEDTLGRGRSAVDSGSVQVVHVRAGMPTPERAPSDSQIHVQLETTRRELAQLARDESAAIQEVEARIGTAQQQIASLNQNIALESAKRASLSRTLTAQLANIQSLETKYKATNARLRDIEDEKSLATKNISRLTTAVVEGTGTVETLRSRANIASQELDRANKELNSQTKIADEVLNRAKSNVEVEAESQMEGVAQIYQYRVNAIIDIFRRS